VSKAFGLYTFNFVILVNRVIHVCGNKPVFFNYKSNILEYFCFVLRKVEAVSVIQKLFICPSVDNVVNNA
jgi:hypothetical protein